MKFHNAFICLVPALFIVTGCSHHQTGPSVREITVAGTAIIKVVPDEMLWSVQVSINDATVAQAKSRHDASLGAMLDYLKSVGDSIKDMQTGGIQFARYDYDNNSDPFYKKNPFNCTTQVTFTLRDFDKYGPIIDKLSQLDGVEIQSVNYDSSKEAETRREALRRALLDGHDKAADLAENAGCAIGQPIALNEDPNVFVQPEMMNSIGGSVADYSPGGTPKAVAGQIEFDAKVTSTYELLPVQ